MKIKITENSVFENINFPEKEALTGTYEDCVFKGCTLTDLSYISFEDCVFEHCNLSMCNLNNTSFKNVKFNNCKLLGLIFTHCNPFLFSVKFENCFLNLASFYKLKLKATTFKNCELQEIDFTNCDLTGAVFDNCNLGLSIFQNTILEKADFITSYNFSIDVENNKMKGVKFSRLNLAGLLDKYNLVLE